MSQSRCRFLRPLAVLVGLLVAGWSGTAAAETQTFETPTSYQVSFEFTQEGKKPVTLTWSEQYNGTRDKQLLAPQWVALMSEDSVYKRYGFDPVSDRTTFPFGKKYPLVTNEPTARQLCGGFAMTPFAGGPYRFPTPEVWKVLQEHATRVDKPQPGDIVAWVREDGSPQHYALIEEISPLGNHTIVTKNQNERVYRGGLTRFNSPPLSDVTELSLAARKLGNVKHAFYRLDPDRVQVKRLGKPHADEQTPPQLMKEDFLVRVVDATNNELLSGANVWVSFQGKKTPAYQKSLGKTDGDGKVLFNIPSGKFTVWAARPGYESAKLDVEVLFENSALVTIALTPRAVQTGCLFLIDTSGSMQGQRIADARRAAEETVRARANQPEEWALLSFSEHNVYEQLEFSTDADAFAAAVSKLQANGDTPLAWAVAQSLIYLYTNSSAPTGQIIILSDGKEECPERSPGGGPKAIESLNRMLGKLKLSQTPHAPVRPGIATVELSPEQVIEFVAFLQPPAAGSSRMLGKPNETVDDALKALEEVAKKNPRPLTISVVGLGIAPGSEDEKQLRSIATAGGGTYVTKADGTGLAQALGGAGRLTREQEPNNSLGTANPANATGQIQGTIDPKGDSDWFIVEVDRQGRLDLRIAQVPADLDVTFQVRNAEGFAISAAFKPEKVGGEAVGSVSLPTSGRYYVNVWNGNANVTSADPYTLELRYHLGDAYEPNNSLGTATPIKSTDEVLANLLPLQDVDWYTFEVPRRGALKVNLTEIPKEVAVQFVLRNADGFDISGAIRGKAAGADNLAVVDLPIAGRYFLVVNDALGKETSPSNYRLSVTYQPGDEYEMNDTAGTASNIEPTAKLTGSILPKGDQDYYTFRVDHPGAVDVKITNVPANLALQFRVLNAERYDISGWQRPLKEGAETEATIDLPTAGRYFLQVNHVGDNERNAEPYTLQTTFHRADAFEPNNTFGTAAGIALNKEVQASILPKGDQDWFVVPITQAGTYEISITNVPKEVDVHVVVRSAEGFAIGDSIRPLRAGAETRGKVKLPAAGKYYLQMYDGNNDARSPQPFTVKIAMVPE